MTEASRPRIGGLHHVTAIATDPRRNVAFYRDTLGLRMVKRTVNFDDPRSYHLYFGSEGGDPGTILTFFARPRARRGSRGVGQAMAVSLAVPPGSLEFWYQRLHGLGLAVDTPRIQFDERRITFLDPDGLKLRLVESARAATRPAWSGGGVEDAYAVRSVYGVTLLEQSRTATEALLVDGLGFERRAVQGDAHRWVAGSGEKQSVVDIFHDPEGSYGQIAAGTIHHVAWRVEDENAQLACRETLRGLGYEVSAVIDRHYFKSIYFREPGGVLFEIATDPPGFAVDEPQEALGSALMLPSWFEDQREEIVSRLPPIE